MKYQSAFDFFETSTANIGTDPPAPVEFQAKESKEGLEETHKEQTEDHKEQPDSKPEEEEEEQAMPTFSVTQK